MNSPAKGYAAHDSLGGLSPFSFERRDLKSDDVQIEILYCGVCHSDIHQVRNEWGGSLYPMVPGHEIVGKVKAVGSAVTKYRPGDKVGVGCMVDSCQDCASCHAGEEQYCDNFATVFTYNSRDREGALTFGGYSNQIIVRESFVLRIPDNLELSASAPLLCAGITTFSPLRHWNVSKGQKVGIVGLGGLGHMALKFAHSMGCHVTQFTTSPGKEKDARRLGAHDVVLTTNPESMASLACSFDFILDTVSAPHDFNQYLNLLRRDGSMVLVGAPEKPTSVASFSLIFKRRQLAGSLIGGIKQTQEMLDYCGEHNIVSDIELISISQINEAYERVLKSDVKYRFVIDMSTL